MKKIYLVYVEHSNDGEVFVELYPYANIKNAVERFHKEVKVCENLTCYEDKEDVEISPIDFQGGDLPCISINHLSDNYNTAIDVRELNLMDKLYM